MTHNETTSICDELELLANSPNLKDINIIGIINHLRSYGFGILIMMFSLPVCAPIPVPPGATTLLSLPLLFFSIQIAIGRSFPWLPKNILKKKIKQSHIKKMVDFINPHLRRVEKYVKPRLAIMYCKTGRLIMGVIWCLFSLSISVPLPMISILPGVGILLSSFGLIKRDGYLILVGYLIGFAGLAIIATVTYTFINSQ